MAMWTIWQENTYLYKTGPEAQTREILRVVNDENEPVLESTIAFFGPGEEYTVTTVEGEYLAKIQYSPQNKPGWVRDREADGDYIVQFRAVRDVLPA